MHKQQSTARHCRSVEVLAPTNTSPKLMGARCGNIACQKVSERWLFHVRLESLGYGGVWDFCSPQCAMQSIEWQQAVLSTESI